MFLKAFKWLCFLLVLACAGAFVGAWQVQARSFREMWDPQRARKANEPIPVRTVKVDQSDLEQTIGGTAVTVPSQTATVTFPASNTLADRVVKQVGCAPGGQVTQGQTMVQLDSSLVELIVKHREAMLATAEHEFQTLKSLHSRKAASGLDLKSAEGAVHTARLELELAKADLQSCLITCPIDGVVDSLNVVPATRVNGGSVVAVVHRLDPIYVQMDYPMERIDALQVGGTAQVVLDAFPQEPLEGEIVRIAPVVSTKTRVLPVTIEIPNPNNRIRAGISGFARIGTSKPDAKAIPSVAVIKHDHRAMIFCVEDGRARIREVKIGAPASGGYVEVLSGVGVGDEVIVYGHDKVKQNDLVNVDWHKWARRDDAAAGVQ